MYIPERFLFGVLPGALTEAHTFWLDDNDTLRGYPKVRDEKTKLYEHVLFCTIEEKTGRAQVHKRVLTAVREQWTEAELQELKRTTEKTEEETGLHNEHGSRKRPTKPSRELDRGVYDDSQELLLLDPLFAHPDSKLRAASKCLVRIETISHILFWKQANASGWLFNRVELPRLRLTLTEKSGRLYSVDHADMSICDEPFLDARPELFTLTLGIPHSLIFVNSNNEPSVLIPLVRPARPFILSSVFSTELVLDRITWAGLATKYLLLPVHVSLSFLQTPTLASALYLLALRFLNRDYVDVQRLVSSVSTDTALTLEEACIMKEISGNSFPLTEKRLCQVFAMAIPMLTLLVYI